MKKALRVIAIILCVLIVLAVIGVAAAGYWLYQYKEKEFSDVEFVVPEGGVEELIMEYQNYPPEPAPDAIVATIGEETLTNGELQVYFWAQVAAHSQTDEVQPDLRVPLKYQKCPLDSSLESWEEYFLLKAVDTWHAVQALTLRGNDEGLPLEERYQPNAEWHAEYLVNKPATAYLYGYNDGYQLNTLHKNYIEQLPALLDEMAADLGYSGSEDLAQAVFGTTEEAVIEAAGLYNRGYSYYTALTYLITMEEEATEEAEATEAADSAATETPCVSFRQVLKIPEHPKWYSKSQQAKEVQVEYGIAADGKVSCVETGWVNCEREAKNMLYQWKTDFLCSEYTFGQMAYESSGDEGSKDHGGYYANVVRGQVLPALEEWLFDPARKVGDTTTIRTEYGVHILYFSEGSTLEAKAEEDAALAAKQLEIIETSKELYPIDVDLTAAAMQPGTEEITFSDFLYEDIAHERFPEVPLYLQRDYGNTMYGNYKLWSHGCGITSMAMLATYLTDEEWTPPELCDMFGSYCGLHGTDVRLFWQANSKLGYLYREYVYDDESAWQALQDGYLVVAQELKGYWTAGGHYIVCEKLTEDGQVVVRDSNILNFGKLEGHNVDYFGWDTITPQACVYFIMGKKPTHIAACTRCGDPGERAIEQIGDSYVCHNCDTALLRRDTFLNGTI